MSAVTFELTQNAGERVIVRTSGVRYAHEVGPNSWKLVTNTTTKWVQATVAGMRSAFGTAPYLEAKDTAGRTFMVRKNAIEVAQPRHGGVVELHVYGGRITAAPSIEIEEYLDQMVGSSEEKQ